MILALLRCSGTELTVSSELTVSLLRCCSILRCCDAVSSELTVPACNCYHLLISFSVKDISLLSLLTFKKTRVLRPFLHGCFSHIHALGLSFCCLLCAHKWTPEQQLRLDWGAVTLSSGWASPFQSPEIAESQKGIHFKPKQLPSPVTSCPTATLPEPHLCVSSLSALQQVISPLTSVMSTSWG